MEKYKKSMNTLPPDPVVEKQVSKIVLEAPFFATLLLYLKRQYTKAIPTMATDGENLLINPDFAATLTPQEVRGVLIHEVLHCAFGHMWRRGDRDPMKANMAMDYAINLIIEDYIKAENASLALPQGCLLDQKYRDMAWERIYNLLPADPPKGNGKGKGKGQGQPGSGNPMDGDVIYQAASKEQAEAKEAQWKNRMAQAAQSARMQGHLPGCVERLVGEILAPKLPWKQLLRQFLTEKIKGDYDWMKPDRRFMPMDLYIPDFGDEETAGEFVLVVDTSGSIGDAEINEFAAEINSIHRDVRPSKTHVLYCDTQIAHVDVFSPDDDIKINPHGGGGTDFSAPYQWIKDNQVPVKALVYFTDLYGTFPTETPPYPVIWACYSDISTAPFGEVINVK
jgi:predicted metal-dependent peptidase